MKINVNQCTINYNQINRTYYTNYLHNQYNRFRKQFYFLLLLFLLFYFELFNSRTIPTVCPLAHLHSFFQYVNSPVCVNGVFALRSHFQMVQTNFELFYSNLTFNLFLLFYGCVSLLSVSVEGWVEKCVKLACEICGLELSTRTTSCNSALGGCAMCHQLNTFPVFYFLCSVYLW